VIYTHSHIDHFGGALGVVDADGMYYAGAGLSVGTEGAVGIGLGSGSSSGTVGLIAPTLDITHTGQEEVLDGVRMIFELPLPRPTGIVHGGKRHT
jgi:alkyl sulfatase BDS1-like metallo-beta-lactamase superfamily hydrolase